MPTSLVGHGGRSSFERLGEQALQEVSPRQLHTLDCQVQRVPTYYNPLLSNRLKRPTINEPYTRATDMTVEESGLKID